MPLKSGYFYDRPKFLPNFSFFKSNFLFSLNPATLKVLDHGYLILMKLPPSMTLAMLSEEPLEAQNKTHKFNERGHSRQDSDLHR